MKQVKISPVPMTITGAGVKPTIAKRKSAVYGDADFDPKKNLMVGQMAFNVDDKVWYYRSKTGIEELVPKSTADQTAAEIKTKLEALEGDERLDASAVKGLPEGNGGGTTTIVEWVSGEPKPTLAVDKMAGDFVEGYQHNVTILTVNDIRIGIITVINDNSKSFTVGVLQYAATCMGKLSDGSFVVGTANPASPSGSLQKFNSDGTENIEFQVNITGNITDCVRSLVVDADDNIIVVGGFYEAGSYFLKKFSSSGIADASFNLAASSISSINDIIYDIAIRIDGSFIIGGNFSGKLKRINQDGTEDTQFASHIPVLTSSTQLVVASKTDNSCFIDATIFKKILSDGSEDVAFNNNIPTLSSSVLGCCIDQQNNVYIGGQFAEHIFKLNPDGTVNSVFSSNIFDTGVVYKPCFINDENRLYVNGLQRTFVDLEGNATGIVMPTSSTIAEVTDGYIYTLGTAVLKVDKFGNEYEPVYEDFLLSYINYLSVMIEPLENSQSGDLLLFDENGKLSKLSIPAVASTLKHSGVADTLPYWEADV